MIKIDNTLKSRIFIYTSLIILFTILLTGCGDDSSGTGLLTDDFLKYENAIDDQSNETTETVTLPSTVYGTVSDFVTGNPISGARINLEDVLTIYTDANGAYTFSNIYMTSGTTTSKNLSITANTYNNLSDTITLTAGASIKADFRLERDTGMITGFVLSNGVKIQNATVIIDGTETITNGNGYFSISNIPTGIKKVEVYIGNTLRFSTMKQIVTNLNNFNINLDDTTGEIIDIASISGKVSDATSGALISDVIINISGIPAIISGTSTSGDGTNNSIKGYFSMTNIPVGNHLVTAIDPNNNYYEYSTYVDLIKGENTLDIPLTPLPKTFNQTGNMVGVVYDTSNKLLENVVLRLRLYDEFFGDYQVFEVFSAVDGWYNFSNMPEGKYILTVQDQNLPRQYVDYYSEDVEIQDGTLFNNIRLTPVTP